MFKHSSPRWLTILLNILYAAFWLAIFLLACAAFILIVGCAARKPPRRLPLDITKACITVDGFAEPLRPDGHGGWVGNGVHFAVKPGPECNEARSDVVRVDRGK